MQESNIKKAIIPIAGLGTRFLPLSLVVPKEFFPLADKPIIQYLIDEARESGITEITFVVGPKQKMAMQYFKEHIDTKDVLERRKKEQQLKDVESFENSFKGIDINYAVQKNPWGNAHAVFQAEKFVGNDAVAVSFGDDVFDSQEPALQQLMNIYKTCNAPVLALSSLPAEKIPSYGSVAVEKIANNLYKIKKIIEKPDPKHIQSNLVSVGKYVLTPTVFEYLRQAKFNEKSELSLADIFAHMINDGLPVYGYELKGNWLECGDKLKWLKSFVYLSLKHPVFGKEIREYIKTLK